MTLEFDAPILGWRTLKDIWRHYLSRTPSEEGTCAAEIIERAEKQALLQRAVTAVAANQGRLAPQERSEMLASVQEATEQAQRMRAIVAHTMIRDAAEGVWFAIGRADGIGKHQLIHPCHWNFLLMNIEKGVVGRDPSLRFEDLRCAFTRDVPDDHPIRANLQASLEDYPPAAPSHTVLREIASPPSAPTSASNRGRHDGPGRPSTFHLIKHEFEQRINNNALEPSLTKQAEVLSA